MEAVLNPTNIYHNSSNADKQVYIAIPQEVSTLPFCDYDNQTLDSDNRTMDMPVHLVVLPYVMVTCYSVICVVGLIGNGLVIYVVLRFAKMKTVTNMYILNLALSDILLLVTLPMTVATTIVKHWMFGFALCKLHFMLYALNLFGGVFNLCVMSADRYLAVCHPIRSMKYRTPRIALFSCFCIWFISFIVMIPVIMYTAIKESKLNPGKHTCAIDWPTDQKIPVQMAFTWYCFILGFAIPVSLISVFYILVILRLRHVGPAKKSKEMRKSHQRVTRLVLTVIAVYVICWLPYWCFQVRLVFMTSVKSTPAIRILVSFFTVLCYTNSMLNPFLYAFLSDNFRKSFVKAFGCVSDIEVCKSAVANENSTFPRTSQTCTRNGHSQSPPEERMELSIQDSASAGVHAPLAEQLSAKSIQDEQGFLKPPTQL